jgi:hypothetical protein
MNSTRALVVLGALLLALVAGGVLFQRILQPTAEITVPLDPACDLGRTACRSAAVGGGVTLDITPRPIAPMKPLHIEVVVEGLTAERLEVDFSGVDMNMGYNRFVLVETAPGRFTGSAVLPVCVRDRMAWEAKVLVDTPGARLSVPFRFESQRGG